MIEAKTYRLGTHRSSTPEQTLTRIQPLLEKMGISRVANVTGLDRIGIPVYNAFRPQSRSVSVSQGKGSEPLAAKVSAIMESVETYHAESMGNTVIFGSISELQSRYRLACTSQMAHAGVKKHGSDDPIHWVEGENLIDGQTYWLPLELVSSDYTLPFKKGSGYFAANTNGLASGNSLKEAICHAIYEVIERDAEALWKQRTEKQRAACGVDINSVDDDNCRALLDKFSAANIDICIWDLSCDTGLACFTCLAVGDNNDWADPEFGTGCHASKHVALARALSEAAQARATFIAGSRDDVGLSEYKPKRRQQRRTAGLRQLQQCKSDRHYPSLASFENATIEQDLDLCIRLLTDIGLSELIVVDLSRDDIGLPVVKTVIPGLEGAYGHWSGTYIPGQRAQQIRPI